MLDHLPLPSHVDGLGIVLNFTTGLFVHGLFSLTIGSYLCNNLCNHFRASIVRIVNGSTDPLDVRCCKDGQ
jgi:hypothetical protein